MEHFVRKKLWLSILFALIVPGILWVTVYNLSYSFIDKIKNSVRSCYSYQPSYPPEIPEFKWKGTGLITIWFDDGWESTYTNAYPVMKEYGYLGTLAIFAGAVCQPSFMTWNEIHELQANGWEINSHSFSHSSNLAYYNSKEGAYKELFLSREILREHGLRINQFVMPFGFSLEDFNIFALNEESYFAKNVKKYYKAYRSGYDLDTNPLPITKPYNLWAFTIRANTKPQEVINHIKQARDKKLWLILVFHQVGEERAEYLKGYEGEDNYNVPVKTLKEILDLVAKSQLPVVLPTQALEAGQVKSSISSIDLTNAYTSLRF